MGHPGVQATPVLCTDRSVAAENEDHMAPGWGDGAPPVIIEENGSVLVLYNSSTPQIYNQSSLQPGLNLSKLTTSNSKITFFSL